MAMVLQGPDRAAGGGGGPAVSGPSDRPGERPEPRRGSAACLSRFETGSGRNGERHSRRCQRGAGTKGMPPGCTLSLHSVVGVPVDIPPAQAHNRLEVITERGESQGKAEK